MAGAQVMRVGRFASRLVDAFVAVIASPLARFRPEDRLVAVEEGEGLTLYHVRRGAVTRLGRADAPGDRERPRTPRAGSVEYRLRSERTLVRTVRLPQAGRDYFPTILAHRLDRLTPWRPDEVLFDFTVGEPGEDGQVVVDLVATSRAIAEEADARLRAVGLTPTTLAAVGPPLEAPAPVDLYRGTRDPRRRALRRRVKVFGIVMFGCLLPASAASFVFAWQAESTLDAVEAGRVAARRNLVTATQTGAAQDRAAALLAAKRRETSSMALLDDLATLLPTDTHLQRLELTQDNIRLVGLSANAPALIGLLEGSPGLANATFAASITRDPDAGDSFDLVADRVAPEATQ